MCASSAVGGELGPQILRVGRDAGGHWVVQDSAGLMEGFFASRDAALAFANSELRATGAGLELASARLVSLLAH